MSIETTESQAAEARSPEQNTTSAPETVLKRVIAPLAASLSSAYAGAQDKSDRTVQGAETYIKRSPFKAIAYVAGIAAVIGVIGGALLGRRSSKSQTGAAE